MLIVSDAFNQLSILDRQRLVHMALKVSQRWLKPRVWESRGKHIYFLENPTYILYVYTVYIHIHYIYRYTNLFFLLLVVDYHVFRYDSSDRLLIYFGTSFIVQSCIFCEASGVVWLEPQGKSCIATYP